MLKWHYLQWLPSRSEVSQLVAEETATDLTIKIDDVEPEGADVAVCKA